MRATVNLMLCRIFLIIVDVRKGEGEGVYCCGQLWTGGEGAKKVENFEDVING
jgi:hypothetical protein